MRRVIVIGMLAALGITGCGPVSCASVCVHTTVLTPVRALSHGVNRTRSVVSGAVTMAPLAAKDKMVNAGATVGLPLGK